MVPQDLEVNRVLWVQQVNMVQKVIEDREVGKDLKVREDNQDFGGTRGKWEKRVK